MAPKNIFIAVICTVLMACTSASAADRYRGDELLGLDLSKAVLSPKPLGPPAGFTPVPAVTKADDSGALLEPKARPTAVARTARVAHLRTVKPRASVRTRLARRHTNPLDAQAFDTRIQMWPCKSGGICDWKRN